MTPIIAFIILFVRIFTLCKITILFLQTSIYPDRYDVSLLTWWIYLLIFDIWVLTQVPAPKDTSDTQENDE